MVPRRSRLETGLPCRQIRADVNGAIVVAASPPTDGAAKFLCDGMLARLCRFLRAAGYDTEMAGVTEHDRKLLERAIEEGRLLLTCDRELAQRRLARGRAIVLPSNGLDQTAFALDYAVSINWLLAPFSRCLVDNTRLRTANQEEHQRLPEPVRKIGREDVCVCPACDRIYWPGRHVRRTLKRLSRWQTARASSPWRLSDRLVQHRSSFRTE